MSSVCPVGVAKRCFTQAGVAQLWRAVRVEEREQLVGKVDPLLPLDQSLLHVWRHKTDTGQQTGCNTWSPRLPASRAAL